MKLQKKLARNNKRSLVALVCGCLRMLAVAARLAM